MFGPNLLVKSTRISWKKMLTLGCPLWISREMSMKRCPPTLKLKDVIIRSPFCPLIYKSILILMKRCDKRMAACDRARTCLDSFPAAARVNMEDGRREGGTLSLFPSHLEGHIYPALFHSQSHTIPPALVLWAHLLRLSGPRWAPGAP